MRRTITRYLILVPVFLISITSSLLILSRGTSATLSQPVAALNTSKCGQIQIAINISDGTAKIVFVPSDNTQVVEWDGVELSAGHYVRVFDPKIDPLNPPFQSQEYGQIEKQITDWSSYEEIETKRTDACNVSVTLVPFFGPLGTEVTVYGNGWPFPGDTVDICWIGCPAQPSILVPVDNHGNFQTTLSVPHDMETGDYWVAFDSKNARPHYAVNLQYFKVTVSCPSDKWYAEYYNNRDLERVPVLTRCDSNIDFYWRTGGPDKDGLIPPDNFSVKWTRIAQFPETGTYRFRTFTDDGVRLYIDGERIVNDWNGHSFTENSAVKQLSSGDHQITMEYFEYVNDAIAHLTWYQCPNGASDCDMYVLGTTRPITAMYQTYYPNVPMPTTCLNWQNPPNQPEQQSFFNFGCTVTSLAMILQYYGVDTTPLALNEWLSKPENKGYPKGTCDGTINWDAIKTFAKEKGVELRYGDKNSTNPNKLLRDNKPVILRKVLKDSQGNTTYSHYFLAVDVVKRKDGSLDIGINDPWSSYGCYSIFKPDGIVNCNSGPQIPTNHATVLSDDKPGFYNEFLYLEKKPKSSSLRSDSTNGASLGFLIDGAEVLLIDNQGRRTGYDPITGQFLEEIPTSMYFDSKIVPYGGTDDRSIKRYLMLSDNASNNYDFQVVGNTSLSSTGVLTNSTNNFFINMYGLDTQYIPSTATILGEISAGQVLDYKVNFQPGTSLTVKRNVFLPLIAK